METTATYIEKVAKLDPQFAAYLSLRKDLDILHNALWEASANRSWFRRPALRILIERFGPLGARHLVEISQPKADNDLALSLRQRSKSERVGLAADSKRRSQAISDAALLVQVMELRSGGLTGDDAIEAALRVT